MTSRRSDILSAGVRCAQRAPRATFLSVALVVMLSTLARAESPRTPIDLELYGHLLDQYTHAVPEPVGTRVDYRGLRDSSAWKGLVAEVTAARPSRLDREAKLAFWINAYNILTIDLVLRHYPVESIKDIGSFFFPVWDKPVATIEGDAMTLGEIEHEILRPMGEPRIHAAIVCASISCPPLARTPFRPEKLDEDLSAAMRAWLANPDKGVAIDPSRQVVTLSRIFDWFEEDFEAQGDVLHVIQPYLSEPDATWLGREGAGASIRYFDYDWSLNDWTATR